jgi:GTP-binding protein Era
MSDIVHRAGFVAIIGRPNVGKSTLLNRLIGERLAIVSHKPQTTRNRILGVLTRPDAQLAFLDTPGVHQARGELNRMMVDAALQAIDEVDVVLHLIEAGPGAGGKMEIGEGNRFILQKLKSAKKPTLLGINKIDQIAKPLLLPLIDAYQKEFSFAEIIPISAIKGEGLEVLVERLTAHLPEGPNLFPEDQITDLAERTIVAEYVREQVLKHCEQEIPYSSAVVVEEFDEAERGEGGTKTLPKGLVRISAIIFVERESQKGILIGKKGSMLKTIGTDARHQIERFLGSKIFLQLTVRVEPRWSENPQGLEKMGYHR